MLTARGAGGLKSRCGRHRFPLEALGVGAGTLSRASLPASVWRPPSVLLGLWAHHSRLCPCLSMCLLFCRGHQSQGAPNDHIFRSLTHYACEDPVSKGGPLLRFWADGTWRDTVPSATPGGQVSPCLNGRKQTAGSFLSPCLRSEEFCTLTTKGQGH